VSWLPPQGGRGGCSRPTESFSKGPAAGITRTEPANASPVGHSQAVVGGLGLSWFRSGRSRNSRARSARHSLNAQLPRRPVRFGGIPGRVDRGQVTGRFKDRLCAQDELWSEPSKRRVATTPRTQQHLGLLGPGPHAPGSCECQRLCPSPLRTRRELFVPGRDVLPIATTALR